MKKKLLGLVNRFRPESFILMYHKISSVMEIDPWRLAVSEQNFENQLIYLKRHYDVMPLHELVENKKENKLKPRSVAITFDDGYRDCFTRAYPLLKKHNLPATFFINSGYIESQEEFWPDRLIRLLLNDFELPANELRLQAIGRSWRLPEWKAQGKSRDEFFMDVWYQLLQAHPVPRSHALVEIEEWLGLSTDVLEESKAMTKEELIEMAGDPLICIGGHTTNHAALGFLDVESQREEIESNKRWLEGVLRKSINGFAYPNGEFNKDTVSLMKEYGFEYACTSREYRSSSLVSDYKLPRYQVCDWNKAEFMQRMSGW